jgi:putative transposase
VEFFEASDCCRENLCLLGDTSISGVRVARELDTLVRLYGKPACIVSDNPVLSLSKGGPSSPAGRS